MTDDKAFHILVALARQPLHGYAIRQEVEARTEGQVRLWPTTLYGLLSDLTGRQLIEETEGPGGPDDQIAEQRRDLAKRSGCHR